ncbi:MAG: response regulator transcription factor [Candidatus Eremiobacteraeota bacterium]|nr:response regulator transcription factor [Candidatus Eremiobacteraeota bacterium]
MFKNKRIYIVEDEKEISDILVMYLKREEYKVTPFYRGDTALEAILDTPPDMAILDIMLPGIDGIAILKEIRNAPYFPVIFLTSKIGEVDRILGLELGADDYIPKPFSPREVVARVRSLFRRTEISRPGKAKNGENQNVIQTRRFTLDLNGRRLISNKKSIRLTATEFAILKLLMGRVGRIYSRTELLDLIWGDEMEGDTRTVDAHIRNLRKKIYEVGGFPNSIQSIRGVGYSFED